MRRTPNHARSLLALAAVAAALFAAVSAWYLLGGQAFAVTLEDRGGDPAELRGFTMSGLLDWNYGRAAQTFALHDGYLDTELVLDDVTPWETVDNAQVFAWQYYTVRPEDHAAVDEAAHADRAAADPFARLYSHTDTLRRMYNVDLPDGSHLRFSAGDVATAESAVSAADFDTGELNSDYDYEYQGDTEALARTWSESPFDDQTFHLGADLGLCWRQPALGRQPGLYRADGLTIDEIAALPRDGEVNGRAVLLASTEFGTLEPFYCPADAAVALAGVSMADDTTLLLYLNTDNLLCADLVDADGTRLDHAELTELPRDVEVDATRMPRETDRDALLKVVLTDDGSAETADYEGPSTRLAVLRVEDGAFVLHEVTPCGIGIDAAYLNAEGNALLITDEMPWNGFPSRTMSSVSEGIALTVRPLDSTLATYQGLLRTGGERDWASLVNYGSSLSYRQVQYTTIEKDRG